MPDNNEPIYIDYAAGKVALELSNHPEFMTAEGNCNTYHNREGGYLGIHHPANVTIDLEEEVEVKQLFIKFMDPNDPLNLTPMDKQSYAFRLLSSVDGERWQLLFESFTTDKPYRVGWVYGTLPDNHKMRYFRVHALDNPASSGFHIVRLRLYNLENPELVEELSLTEDNRIELAKTYEVEVGDSTPLSVRLQNLSEQLYRSVPEIYRDERFNTLHGDIIEKSFELQAVDGRIDQVRNIITPHIGKSMSDDYIKNKRTFWIQTVTSIALVVIYVVIMIIRMC